MTHMEGIGMPKPGGSDLRMITFCNPKPLNRHNQASAPHDSDGPGFLDSGFCGEDRRKRSAMLLPTVISVLKLKGT